MQLELVHSSLCHFLKLLSAGSNVRRAHILDKSYKLSYSELTLTQVGGIGGHALEQLCMLIKQESARLGVGVFSLQVCRMPRYEQLVVYSCVVAFPAN